MTTPARNAAPHVRDASSAALISSDFYKLAAEAAIARLDKIGRLLEPPVLNGQRLWGNVPITSVAHAHYLATEEVDPDA